MDIIKSSNDNRIYKNIILPNKLEALLIYDPDINTGAACMTVHVGHYNDPDDYPGLAHFLEHMLFMGSKKYKNENHYFKYLNEHGGTSNAYTDSEETVYYFDVNADNLIEALDIFSRFFIDPLFKEDAVHREINAVDSEHSKNYIIDDWRMGRILNVISRKEYPFHKFSTGNKKTLHDDIREQLIDFYNTYYSANLMKFAIIWNKPIKDLEKLIVGLFSSVPNNNVKRRNYNGRAFNFSNSKLCHKLVKMVPIADIDKLCIYWQLENVRKYFKHKPLEYISHLLGHENKNSLHHALKSNGWISELYAGEYNTDDSMSLYMINIDLTKDGYSHIPTIINMLYEYLNVITNNINEWIYDELKQINEIEYKYLDKINPIDYVVILASNMIKYPTYYAASIPYIYNKYTNKTKNIIEKYLFNLIPQHSIIIINSKRCKNCATNTEKYYNISYNVQTNPASFNDELENSDINHINHINHNTFKLPTKNIFIPKNTQILPTTYQNKYPIKLKDSLVDVWYKQDTKFKKPRIRLIINLYTKKIMKNPFNYALYHLYIKYIEHILNPYIYDINVANSNVLVTILDGNIHINIDAYNDIILKIIQRLINIMTHFELDKQVFEIIKNEYELRLKNFIYNTPFVLCSEYFKEKIYSKYYTHVELLEALKDISHNDLIKIKKWIKDNKIRCFIYGNLDTNIVTSLSKILSVFSRSTKNITIPNIVKELDNGDIELYLRGSHNPQENDSIIHIFYEIGNIKKGITNNWDENIVLLMLIHKMVNERFFDKLRTIEQTGYLVKSFVSIFGHAENPTYGLSYIIQSSKKIPYTLRKKIKIFVHDTFKYIKQMDHNTYQKYIHAIIYDLQKKDTNRHDEFSRYSEEIFCGSELFDIRDRYIKILNKLKHDDVVAYYEKYFVNKHTRKIRIVELYASLFSS